MKLLLSIFIFGLVACGGGTGTSTGSTDNFAALSWTAPTENVDGSPLDDLAGYKIYYGVTPGNYTTTIRIDNPSVTEYLVTDLPTGHTYYFVVTAFDLSENESIYSNEASKVILFYRRFKHEIFISFNIITGLF